MTLKGVHRKPKEEFSFSEADDRIFDIFRNHEFSHISHDVRHKLVKFYFLLMEEQKRQNLTRLITLRETAIKHFIDCLMVPKLTELEFPLLDMGTGAGFPGVPLKFVFPQEKIILAEGVQKRVEFLKSVREQMNLKELDILGKKISADFSYPVKAVITRAVLEIPQTLKNCKGCLPIGGKLYFMKGPQVDGEIRDAKAQLASLYKLVEDHHYNIPKTPHQRLEIREADPKRRKSSLQKLVEAFGFKGN